MPLYKSIHVSPGVVVLIWKIEESEEELARDIELSDHCQQRVSGMKSELHRRGFLSIRHLLKEVGYTDFDLYYDQAGKPHLKDGNFISISHSFTFTGIIVSEKSAVGIDIEKQREKIKRIAHKFTTFDTSAHRGDAGELVRILTVLWGAKESLYKIYATQGLSFLQHITIDPIALESGRTSGRIHYEDQTTLYQLAFLEFEGFSCVYALAESAETLSESETLK